MTSPFMFISSQWGPSQWKCMTFMFQHGYCEQPASEAPGFSRESILALARIHLLTVRNEGMSFLALCSLPHSLPISKPVLGKGDWVAVRPEILLRSPSGVYFHPQQPVISISHALVCRFSLFCRKDLEAPPSFQYLSHNYVVSHIC